MDFEHQRREEVIQYIYAKYGRERAAIAATVISYRPRSALRDVGHALEIPEELIVALPKALRSAEAVVIHDLKVGGNGETRTINLTVYPVR